MLYAHTRAEKGDVIWTSSVLRWIEAEVALGPRRFFLLDGRWYEIGEAYLEAIRSQVKRLITGTPSVDLPAWVLGDKERDYNESVPDLRPGYVCFDRDNVRTALHRGNGVAICDLLSPDDVLVMVKRAKGSEALSHLFGHRSPKSPSCRWPGSLRRGASPSRSSGSRSRQCLQPGRESVVWPRSRGGASTHFLARPWVQPS
ncbi:TIGR04141 family sporadically distributed protein [Streptomyces sp. DASNCL29]|uniref:TIGR04141 family sporadically distributed protein n=1 Tax=Streptomyces sp. DASNCL29 TaxID=2583819 RepID=UPI0023EFEE85|nr:TIGR04141 family sporadically distributed protein [Streptomyces sp. DASNCL29]